MFALLRLLPSVLLLGCAGVCVYALEIPQVQDLPFQATQVITWRSPGGHAVISRGRLARNGFGSTYVEVVDPKSGTPTEILILDVPGKRSIVLDVLRRRYRVQAAPQIQARALSETWVLQQLQMAVAEKDSSLHEVHDGLDLTLTHLGTRRVSGVEAIGQMEVRRPLAGAGEMVQGPAQVQERWFSVDLGISVLMTYRDAVNGEDTEALLTQILRTEPDRSLFTIPVGYLPEIGAAKVTGRTNF